MNDANATPFASLSPDCIIDAVESLGLNCDGRLLALNSYENRVYQVGRDDGPPLVAKFYRPGRWTMRPSSRSTNSCKRCTRTSCRWCRR